MIRVLLYSHQYIWRIFFFSIIIAYLILFSTFNYHKYKSYKMRLCDKSFQLFTIFSKYIKIKIGTTPKNFYHIKGGVVNSGQYWIKGAIYMKHELCTIYIPLATGTDFEFWEKNATTCFVISSGISPKSWAV